MKQMLATVVGVAVSAVLAGSVHAQSATANACQDVRWKAEILLKYPGIEKSCVDVVVRDGVKYVKVSGKVRSKDKGVLAVDLDHTKSQLKWKPDKDDTVSIEGKALPAMDVQLGQSLRFYMPEDRVAVVDISEAGVKSREVVP